MFTVKATYRTETRKLTFPESVLFPTYEDLYHQLYRVFPISHNYYLSRLIFAPDVSKPGRILIGKEVHSAQDYDPCVTPLRRQWPNPLLRFTIFDEPPYKSRFITPEKVALSSAPSIALSEVTSKSTSTIPRPPTCILPMNSQSFITSSPPPPPPQLVKTCVLPPPPPPVIISPPPLPPIIFSSPASRPSSPLGAKAPGAPCCSVAKGKADVEALMASFKEELQRILRDAFGDNYAEQQATALGASKAIVTDVDSNPVSTSPINTTTASSRWCFVCRTNFTGVWYGCIKCPWHAVCPGCFTKSQSAHTLSFGPSHVVQQRSTDCPCAQASTQDSEEIKPLGNTSTVTMPHVPSGNERDAVLPVHRGVICGSCTGTIAGIRHKCLDCLDYDLCTNCFKSGATEKHNPFHEFFDIETPGRVFVHTVFDGHRDGSPDNRQQLSGADHPTVASQGQVADSVDPPARHSATCNLCDSPIVGERYKCVTCPDFDTCSSCFRITPEQHPSHGFVRLSKPEDLMMRDSLRHRQAPHFAKCDSCGQTIWGARYKCMHPSCPDFDLCSNCEALPIAVHPLNHPMLKLKTADSVIPTVYRVGQTWMVDGPAYQISMPDSAHSNSLPERSPSPPPTSVRSLEPSRASLPVASSVAAQSSDVSTETPDAVEAFLSPPGSPASEAPKLAPTNSTNAPPHLLVDIAESAEVPASTFPALDLFHQLWPKVNQEMMHLQASKANDSTSIPSDSPAEPVVDSSLVIKELPSATPASPVPQPLCSVGASGYHTPTSVSSTPQALQPVTAPANDERPLDLVGTNVSPPAFMSSVFVGDTTVPDGQIFPPGAEFVKAWHMRNNGDLPWPATTEVQFVAGEMFMPQCSVTLKAKVGTVHPGEDLDIWTGDLKAPDVPGRYVGYWRLNDGQGNFFGSSVWIDVTVADHRSSDLASEHSLASSAMVMPSPHRTDSINVSEELKHVPPPPSSLSSAKPVTDEVDDHGSDISSVSLVSVPTSDDEDAEWQDTRSQSEPMEYVVLYDSASEDE